MLLHRLCDFTFDCNCHTVLWLRRRFSRVFCRIVTLEFRVQPAIPKTAKTISLTRKLPTNMQCYTSLYIHVHFAYQGRENVMSTTVRLVEQRYICHTNIS